MLLLCRDREATLVRSFLLNAASFIVRRWRVTSASFPLRYFFTLWVSLLSRLAAVRRPIHFRVFLTFVLIQISGSTLDVSEDELLGSLTPARVVAAA